MTTTAPHDSSARELFDEMCRWPIYDPHSHIDAHRPAARNFDEILELQTMIVVSAAPTKIQVNFRSRNS